MAFNVAGTAASIYSDATNDAALIEFVSQGIGNETFTFELGYTVI